MRKKPVGPQVSDIKKNIVTEWTGNIQNQSAGLAARTSRTTDFTVLSSQMRR